MVMSRSHEVDEPPAGGLEAIGHHLGDPEHEPVAEGGILVEGAAELCGVDGDGPDGGLRDGVEPPPMRWKQPGPPEDRTLVDRLDAEGGGSALDAEGDHARDDEEEPVGVVAGAEDHVEGFELDETGGVEESGDVVGWESPNEGVGAELVFEDVRGHRHGGQSTGWFAP